MISTSNLVHYISNPSTSSVTLLFGDDLNKEMEELTKANKLSVKVNAKQQQRFAPYRIPSRHQPLPDFNRGSQGRRPLRPFLRARRGQYRVPTPTKYQKNKV